MNDQIQKLLHAAATHVGRYVTPGSVQNLHTAINEKFAELLIAECVILCKKVEDDNELTDCDVGFRDGAMLCQLEIKEHFGVKE